MITDAIVLIAVSQLVCLGAIGYLAMQVHSLHREGAAHEPQPPRNQRGAPAMELVRRSAVSAYAGRGPAQPSRLNQAQQAANATNAAGGAIPRLPATDAREIVEKMARLGVDVPTLARRVGRSEEEIRLILRRHGGLPAGATRSPGGAI